MVSEQGGQGGTGRERVTPRRSVAFPPNSLRPSVHLLTVTLVPTAVRGGSGRGAERVRGGEENPKNKDGYL